MLSVYLLDYLKHSISCKTRIFGVPRLGLHTVCRESQFPQDDDDGDRCVLISVKLRRPQQLFRVGDLQKVKGLAGVKYGSTKIKFSGSKNALVSITLLR